MAVVACGNKWQMCSVTAIQGMQTVTAVKFRSYSQKSHLTQKKYLFL